MAKRSPEQAAGEALVFEATQTALTDFEVEPVVKKFPGGGIDLARRVTPRPRPPSLFEKLAPAAAAWAEEQKEDRLRRKAEMEAAEDNLAGVRETDILNADFLGMTPREYHEFLKQPDSDWVLRTIYQGLATDVAGARQVLAARERAADDEADKIIDEVNLRFNRRGRPRDKADRMFTADFNVEHPPRKRRSKSRAQVTARARNWLRSGREGPAAINRLSPAEARANEAIRELEAAQNSGIIFDRAGFPWRKK